MVTVANLRRSNFEHPNGQFNWWENRYDSKLCKMNWSFTCLVIKFMVCGKREKNKGNIVGI